MKVGLEEEEIHTSQLVGPIVVGYVVDATPEPQKNGKIINWCHVDVGDEYNETDENGNKVPRGIICGAPNMAAGEKVVVTLPGAVLPGDFKIEPRKTYGHISNGMCASERELGLGDNHDGIILLRKYGFTPEEYEKLQPATTPCTCCTWMSRCWRSTSLRIAATRSHTVACLANTIIPPVPPTPILLSL